MKRINFIYPIFLILLGVAMFIYGGYDDSPGGQLLGVLGGAFGVRRIYKLLKENKN